jgi:hypothetical protein
MAFKNAKRAPTAIGTRLLTSDHAGSGISFPNKIADLERQQQLDGARRGER